MKKSYTLVFTAVFSVLSLGAEELKITADSITADRSSGAFSAKGNVKATLPPMTLTSQSVQKTGDGEYEFDSSTEITTCTNAVGHRHWAARGKLKYRQAEYAKMTNGLLSLWEIPALWLPFWYYPIDTDYGWRVMPWYSSRHGASLYVKYVYNLAGSLEDGCYGLGASTRLDLRSKNGVAAGQSFSWQLGDYGSGKFKVYYADDDDYDRYDRNWTNSKKYNYQNWGSTVDRERWGVAFAHSAEITERDRVRVSVASYSDSYFRRDFLRDNLFSGRSDFNDFSGSRNEAAWEHLEKSFSAGLSVSGPIDEFYSGVMRLPEFYFDAAPVKILNTPLYYESESSAGYYNRQYAKYGSSSTSDAYRYNPGPWANYNTARFDTYHRVSAPLRIADIVSAVPRVGYRGSFWGESGALADASSRAYTASDQVWRSVYEAGVTFSARGTADFGDGKRHILEPYVDFLAQEADYHGLTAGSRPYMFDNCEGSYDYLDQFAGRSRNLPYSWYGFTPGIRNVLRTTDENGVSRTLFDFDVYASVQLNDTSYFGGGRWTKLSADVEDPNYGNDDFIVMPGARLKWNPTRETSLFARAEWDGDNDRLAYADILFTQKLTDRLSWRVELNSRDHRYWDYAPMIIDSDMRKDMFNHNRQKFAEAGFVYEITDSLVIGPYAIFDIDEAELAEIGSMVDLRTDCLGFRFMLSYETEYERVDRSEEKSDFRCGFFIYLRALGPDAANPFRRDAF